MRAGFTLVELMVVVSIIAILAGLAASFMRSPRDERALRSASDTMTALFAQARNRAVSTGQAVILELEASVKLQDYATGALIGDGTRLSRIGIYDSVDANCSGRKTDPLLPVRILDPNEPDASYGHVVITRIAPIRASGAMAICFTPTGRVVDPLTGRALASVGSSAFGGRLLVELRPVTCKGADCTIRPDRRTVSLGFNGVTEVLGSGFDLGAF